MPRLSPIQLVVLPDVVRLPCKTVIFPGKPFRVIYKKTGHVVNAFDPTSR
jgi:hypothetical protein